jgi:hypothetical protein
MTRQVVAGVALGAALCALAALVLGEYELVGALPAVAGLVLGLMVGEVVGDVTRRRSPALGLVAAAMVAGSLLWAAWIDTGQGLRPFPVAVWPAMAIGAAAAGLTAGRDARNDAAEAAKRWPRSVCARSTPLLVATRA